MTVVRNEFEMRRERARARVLNQRIDGAALSTGTTTARTPIGVAVGHRERADRAPAGLLPDVLSAGQRGAASIAGKFDEAKTLGLVAHDLRTLPEADARAADVLHRRARRRTANERSRCAAWATSRWSGRPYHIPPAGHPDFAPVEVLFHLLGDTPAGRLYKALVEPGLATATFGYADAMLDPGLAWTGATVRKEGLYRRRARHAMLGVLDGLGTNPPTQAELDRVAPRAAQGHRAGAARPPIRFGLDDERVSRGGRLAPVLPADATAFGQVTLDDIKRVAGMYIKSSNRTVGVFVPIDVPDRAVIPARPDLAAAVQGLPRRSQHAGGRSL